jgi:hypothetical protein
MKEGRRLCPPAPGKFPPDLKLSEAKLIGETNPVGVEIELID